METTADNFMDEFEKTVLSYAQQHGLFTPNCRVIAACSGGADSMALLLFLLRQQDKLGIQVEACHVNHGLRGSSADRDEAFVTEFCERNNVVLHRFRPNNVPTNAGETWARQLRYGFFGELLADEGDETVIATAHTLTDQAETLLLRMARGTGIHGMGGIPVKRPGYRRPLLCVDRQQTQSYCLRQGQEWQTDETNLTDAYARNRIRHYVLPVLRQLNPRTEQAIERLAAVSRRVDEYLQRRAGALLRDAGNALPPGQWSLKVLRQAEPVELEWALHSLVERWRDPEEKYIFALLRAVQSGTGSVQLTDNVRFTAKKELLTQQKRQEIEAAEPRPLVPGEYTLPGGYRLRIRLLLKKDIKNPANIHRKDLNYLADYDRILSGTVIRTRLPGDWFRSSQRGQKKTLKKLYNELKLTAAERAQLPLAAAGNRVFWLWGQGFAAGTEPDSSTQRLLQITEYHDEGETV